MKRVSCLVGIRDLSPGDLFIWADSNTRNTMIVDLVYGRRVGLQQFNELSPNDGFRFTDLLNGPEVDHHFCYGPEDRVYRLDHGSGTCIPRSDCDWDVLCLSCGKRYGQHIGVECPEPGKIILVNGRPVGVFVPDQRSVLFSDDDWFAQELGV